MVHACHLLGFAGGPGPRIERLQDSCRQDRLGLPNFGVRPIEVAEYVAAPTQQLKVVAHRNASFRRLRRSRIADKVYLRLRRSNSGLCHFLKDMHDPHGRADLHGVNDPVGFASMPQCQFQDAGSKAGQRLGNFGIPTFRDDLSASSKRS